MYIKSIDINEFGNLENKSYNFEKGINIIEGKNESGKSTIAEFIRYALYGLPQKLSDKKKYLSLKSGRADGTLTLSFKNKSYRIERYSYISGASLPSKLKVIDEETNSIIDSIASPGEYFTGLSRELFSQSSYVSQLAFGVPDTNEIVVQIDNMFSSGSESTNVKKALEKLNKARKTLMPQSSKFGRLRILEDKIIQTRSLLEKNTKVNNSIITLEQSIIKSKKDAEKIKIERDREEKIIDGFNSREILKKFEEYRKQKTHIDDLHNNLSHIKQSNTINNFTPDEDYISNLKNIENKLKISQRLLEKANIEYALKLEENKKKQCENDLLEPHKYEEKAEILTSKKHNVLTGAVIFSCFSAMSLLLSLGFYLFDFFDYILIPALFALIMMVISSVFFVNYNKHKSNLRNVFLKFGAVNAKQFKKNLELKKQSIIENDIFSVQLDKAEKEYTEMKKEYIELYRLAERIAYKVSSSSSDVFDAIKNALEKAEEYLEKTNSINAELELAHKRLEDISPFIAGQDESMLKSVCENLPDENKYDLTALKGNLKFRNAQLEKLQERINNLEREYAVLIKDFIPPSDIQSELDSLNGEYIKCKEVYDACLLAISKLEESSGNLRERISPALTEYTSEMLSRVTRGRYTSIGFSDKLIPTCTEVINGTQNIDFVSSGTRDLIYISFRLALNDYLSGQTNSLMIFDESFSRLDNERLQELLEILSSESNRQIIILANHSREEDMLQGMCDINKIHLD